MGFGKAKIFDRRSNISSFSERERTKKPTWRVMGQVSSSHNSIVRSLRRVNTLRIMDGTITSRHDKVMRAAS